MGLADLHVHSTHSYDGTSTVRAVLQKATDIGLDVIAVTDHDEIRGSLEAVDLAPKYGLTAVPGIEVSTESGHLLALFVERVIPRGLPVAETIRRVSDAGGLCIVPHPGDHKIISIEAAIIRSALRDAGLARTLVGIEVFNAGLLRPSWNRVAQELAEAFPVAQVGDSDAHLLWMIGKGATWFEGTSDGDLRRALETRATRAVAHPPVSRPVLFAHMGARLALRYAGWVTTNAYPGAPLQLARA